MGLHHLSPQEAERLDRRIRYAEREAETKQSQANNRRTAMAHYKTRVGDTVQSPDSLEAVEAELDSLYEESLDAIDTIREVARRQSYMAGG